MALAGGGPGQQDLDLDGHTCFQSARTTPPRPSRPPTRRRSTTGSSSPSSCRACLARRTASGGCTDLCRNQGGSDFGQLALPRPLAAPDHAAGCPEPGPASANQPLGPRWPGHISRLFFDTGAPAATTTTSTCVAATALKAPCDRLGARRTTRRTPSQRASPQAASPQQAARRQRAARQRAAPHQPRAAPVARPLRLSVRSGVSSSTEDS